MNFFLKFLLFLQFLQFFYNVQAYKDPFHSNDLIASNSKVSVRFGNSSSLKLFCDKLNKEFVSALPLGGWLEDYNKRSENEIDKMAALMANFKEAICEAMFHCWNSPAEYAPPEIRDRFHLSKWLADQIMQNETDIPGNQNSLDKSKREFNAWSGCDLEGDFSLGDDALEMLMPESASQLLEHYENQCGSANVTRSKQLQQQLASLMPKIRAKRSVWKSSVKRGIQKPKGWEWRWKNPIKYKFHKSIQQNVSLLATIREAIEHIHSQTCIHFERDDYIDDDQAHILFKNRIDDEEFEKEYADEEELGKGHWRCQSLGIGRHGGKHIVSIDTQYFGRAVHELCHALGLFHEMQRVDRDKYIWTSVNKLDEEFMELLGTPKEALKGYGHPYDFGSVMHYNPRWNMDKFEKKVYDMVSYNRLYQHSMGTDANTGLSFRDSHVLNHFYCLDDQFNHECKDVEKLDNCLHNGYQDPLACDRCRCPRGFAGKFCEELVENEPEICASNVDEFDIKLQENSIFTLTGQISGSGSCFWLIQPITKSGAHMYLEEMHITDLTCLECPRTGKKKDCQQDNWIYPCTSYLRVQYQDNKIESGARICCQEETPFHISSQTDKFLSENSEILLELKALEVDEDVTFRIEIRTGPKTGKIIEPATTTTEELTTSTTPTETDEITTTPEIETTPPSTSMSADTEITEMTTSIETSTEESPEEFSTPMEIPPWTSTTEEQEEFSTPMEIPRTTTKEEFSTPMAVPTTIPTTTSTPSTTTTTPTTTTTTTPSTTSITTTTTTPTTTSSTRTSTTTTEKTTTTTTKKTTTTTTEEPRKPPRLLHSCNCDNPRKLFIDSRNPNREMIDMHGWPPRCHSGSMLNAGFSCQINSEFKVNGVDVQPHESHPSYKDGIYMREIRIYCLIYEHESKPFWGWYRTYQHPPPDYVVPIAVDEVMCYAFNKI